MVSICAGTYPAACGRKRCWRTGRAFAAPYQNPEQHAMLFAHMARARPLAAVTKFIIITKRLLYRTSLMYNNISVNKAMNNGLSVSVCLRLSLCISRSLSLSLGLCHCVCVLLAVFLAICLSVWVCVSDFLYGCLSVSVCPFVCLSDCLCLSFCLSASVCLLKMPSAGHRPLPQLGGRFPS